MASTRGFYWKVFTSFTLLFAFVAIALSGAVLYVAPPGRVANWSAWSLGALQKGDWQAVHTVFAFIFIVLAVTHLVFNWRVILAYLRMRIASGVRRRRELAASGLLATSVLAATLFSAPPFSTVMRVGDRLKNGWISADRDAPVPHAEILTLARLADTVRVPADVLVANLKRAGIDAAPDVTLADVAARRGATPAAVYALATSGIAKPRAGIAEGGGYGWKTIEQVATQLEVPVGAALMRLEAHGIPAKATDVVKEVASAHGRTPISVVKLLAGE
jgi:hypothetical protein